MEKATLAREDPMQDLIQIVYRDRYCVSGRATLVRVAFSPVHRAARTDRVDEAVHWNHVLKRTPVHASSLELALEFWCRRSGECWAGRASSSKLLRTPSKSPAPCDLAISARSSHRGRSHAKPATLDVVELVRERNWSESVTRKPRHGRQTAQWN